MLADLGQQSNDEINPRGKEGVNEKIFKDFIPEKNCSNPKWEEVL